VSQQKRDAKQLTRAAESLTGRWFCGSGQHFVTGDAVLRNGRRVCIACSRRMAELRRKQRNQG
jgi:hypothetical protein